MVELCYIDGLVSTGNQIPYTILEIIFPNQKIFLNYFINIFFSPVDKATKFLPNHTGIYTNPPSCDINFLLVKKI